MSGGVNGVNGPYLSTIDEWWTAGVDCQQSPFSLNKATLAQKPSSQAAKQGCCIKCRKVTINDSLSWPAGQVAPVVRLP
eukprot:353758-Chlamydomonas_euryale.AAC.4